METSKSLICQGFTLIEMLAVLTIGAVVAGLAVPGFASLRRDTGLTAAADQLLGALYFAQRSAARTGIPTVLCLSGGDACTAPGALASAWQVLLAPSSSPTAPASSGTLVSVGAVGDIEIRGTRPAVTFWPAARAGATATFTLCDPRDRTVGRAIVVSETGRPRATTVGASACAP